MNGKVIFIFALILVAFVLSGCQTIQGVGRDITWSAQASEEVLDDMFDEPDYRDTTRSRRSRYDY
jgi:predicted small secreted protein